MTRTTLLSILTLLVSAALPCSALQFNMFLLSYNSTSGSSGYVVQVQFSASENEFDDLVDGYTVTSPGGGFFVGVSVDSPSFTGQVMFPDFASLTQAIYGDWTLSSTVFGTPLDKVSFRVRSAGLAASDLPPAHILSPAADASNVSATPLITFKGPANATDIALILNSDAGGYPDGGVVLLPANTTQHTPAFLLNVGRNNLKVVYYLPKTAVDKVSISRPAGFAWATSFSRAAIAESDFTVAGPELRLTGPDRQGDPLQWSFSTEAGVTYNVEYNNDLNSSNWQVLQTLGGDGSVQSFTVVADQTARFFRVSKQ